MRKILVAFALMGIALSAHAQTVENDLIGLGMKPEVAEYISGIIPGGSVLGNDTFLKGRNQANSADISALKVDATDDTVVNADSGDLIKLSVATTPVAQMGASGFTVLPIAGNPSYAANTSNVFTAYVPTMAATPLAGTNDLKLGINVVPTAAADTAALMPTPVAANVSLSVINSMANAVRIKAGGTNTINGSAAGAYIPLVAQGRVECYADSATNWRCNNSAVPTPAGP